jgi:hypothetical protein
MTDNLRREAEQALAVIESRLAALPKEEVIKVEVSDETLHEIQQVLRERGKFSMARVGSLLYP